MKNQDFISYKLSTDKSGWFVVEELPGIPLNSENIDLANTHIECPFCGEEMPDYIKFQAMLLTK